LAGYTLSDDVLSQGNQSNFTRAVPASAIWSYTIIRSLNLMINRVQDRMSSRLSPEAYKHWLGVGRIFRAYRNWELVYAYGDVPYYDELVGDVDYDELYEDRTPRNACM